MKDRSAAYQSARRIRDQAKVLLLLGIVFLVSPVAAIFQIDAKLIGVPVTLIYLFVVWAAMIVGARFLSHRLGQLEERDERRRPESSK